MSFYDPMSADFPFTIGIEEEYQVVDPETRQLKSHIQELFAEGEKRLKDEIKREMHDPVIEVGTPICQNVTEARREVTRRVTTSCCTRCRCSRGQISFSDCTYTSQSRTSRRAFRS